MANYGEVIGNYNPEYDRIYREIDSYFNHPTMYKIKNTDGKYSVYMSKTYCLLSKECRYLVAIVALNYMPIGGIEKLENLQWISFQTRTLEDNHDLPPHNYQAKRDGFLKKVIDKITNTDGYSLYSCSELPIQVTLLHTKAGSSDYKPKGNVIAALETYQTIITLK